MCRHGCIRDVYKSLCPLLFIYQPLYSGFRFQCHSSQTHSHQIKKNEQVLFISEVEKTKILFHHQVPGQSIVAMS